MIVALVGVKVVQPAACRRAVKAAAAPVTPAPLATSTGTLAGGRLGTVVVVTWWCPVLVWVGVLVDVVVAPTALEATAAREGWMVAKSSTVATTKRTSTRPARTIGNSPTRDRGLPDEGRSSLSEGGSTARKPANRRWKAQAAEKPAVAVSLE